jgi:hypothetical protein
MGQNKLLKNQDQVSPQIPMPVDRMDSSSLASSYSEGTVQLYYYSAGTRTLDAGQAAGVVVDGVFTYQNIYDSLGVAIATKNNTSLSFTCTALTTEIDVATRPELQRVMEGNDTSTPAVKAAAIGALLNNGEYVVDYRKGMVWAKKATTAATMTTTTYSIIASSNSVAVTSVIPGTGATNLGKAEDAAHTSGDVGVMALAVRNDAGTALAGTDGDYIPLGTDASGNLRVIAAGGGGSTGGGNSSYSVSQGDFTATVTDSSNNIVLSTDSLGGSAITEANFANAILKVWNADVEEMVTITLDDFTWTPATKTLDTSNCTGAFTFATADVVSLTMIGPDKNRDTSADATKSVEQSPLNTQHISNSLVDTTNVTAATHYYPSSTGATMDGYKDLSCSGKLIDADGTLTLSLEAMNDEDTSSGDWKEVELYNDDSTVRAAVQNITVTNGTLIFAVSANNLNYRYYRWVVVASGATNTVILKERKKAL